MKKIVLVLFLLFVVFVVVEKQRLYLRDPLGSVVRDGVKDDNAQVYINYANDVLLENDHASGYLTVVQHDNHVGTPVTMKGMHYIVYLADADVVPLLQADNAAVVDSMTGKTVAYHSGKHVVAVTLR